MARAGAGEQSAEPGWGVGCLLSVSGVGGYFGLRVWPLGLLCFLEDDSCIHQVFCCASAMMTKRRGVRQGSGSELGLLEVGVSGLRPRPLQRLIGRVHRAVSSRERQCNNDCHVCPF